MSDRLFDLPEAPPPAAAPTIDASPLAEAKRRFQIAHLIHGRETSDMAHICEVSDRTIQRWIEFGCTWDQADLFTCRVLGVNPVVYFGTEWEEMASAGLDVNQDSLLDADF